MQPEKYNHDYRLDQASFRKWNEERLNEETWEDAIIEEHDTLLRIYRNEREYARKGLRIK